MRIRACNSRLSVGDRPLDVTRDEVDVALRYGALADSRLVARTLRRFAAGALRFAGLPAAAPGAADAARPAAAQLPDLPPRRTAPAAVALRARRPVDGGARGRRPHRRRRLARAPVDAGRPRHHAQVGAGRAAGRGARARWFGCCPNGTPSPIRCMRSCPAAASCRRACGRWSISWRSSSRRCPALRSPHDRPCQPLLVPTHDARLRRARSGDDRRGAAARRHRAAWAASAAGRGFDPGRRHRGRRAAAAAGRLAGALPADPADRPEPGARALRGHADPVGRDPDSRLERDRRRRGARGRAESWCSSMRTAGTPARWTSSRASCARRTGSSSTA